MVVRFHPELFELRERALAILTEAGYQWSTDFSTVDLDHERYGFEVCGIPEKPLAQEIAKALHREWSTWHSWLVNKDWGDRDVGWKACITREPPNPGRPRSDI